MHDEEDLEFLRGLREEFLEECHENLDNLENIMLNYESSADEETLKSFMRTLHSMKGSARAVDLHTMGQVIHLLETLCVNKEADLVENILKNIDNLRKYADLMKARQEAEGEVFINYIHKKLGG